MPLLPTQNAPINVTIESLPDPSLFQEWAPFLISLFALAVSLYAIWKAGSQFQQSSRPFVWTMDFCALDEKQQIKNYPETIMIFVKNSPARLVLVRHVFQLVHSDDELHRFEVRDLVRFPDNEKTQHTYTSTEVQDAIGNLQPGQSLVRNTRIEYQHLSNKRMYSYERCSTLRQGKSKWDDDYSYAT